VSRRLRTVVRLSEIKQAAEEQCLQPSLEGDQRWRRDDVRQQTVPNASCGDCDSAVADGDATRCKILRCTIYSRCQGWSLWCTIALLLGSQFSGTREEVTGKVKGMTSFCEESWMICSEWFQNWHQQGLLDTPKFNFAFHIVSKRSLVWIAITLRHINQFWWFLAEMLSRKCEVKGCCIFPPHLPTATASTKVIYWYWWW